VFAPLTAVKPHLHQQLIAADSLNVDDMTECELLINEALFFKFTRVVNN